MNIFEIFNQFETNEEIVAYKRFGNGHINSTFLVYTLKRNLFVFQKINTNIFKDPDSLMNNINQVTSHLKNKNIETIMMNKTKDGKLYVKDNDSCCRLYKFIDDTLTFEKPEGMGTVKNAAKAFGKFHCNLADLDATKLVETIPHFHDTPKRYNDLLNAIKEDKMGRLSSVQREIEIVQRYVPIYSYIVDGIESGEVKLHITHNDPKINNALFDDNTHKFRSIIDLDTVMPGSVLYDFGDALRSLFTGDNEDSTDYKNVVGNKDIFLNYLKSYFAETKSFLTKREIELFPYAPFILTMECGMRFLEDYLRGDVYFKTSRENHNLDRARTQINLAESIIKNIDVYKTITEKVTNL